MRLSLILLKTGQYLVSMTEELELEPRVHLSNPYVISGKTKLTLTRWPEYTDDEDILLRSEDLLTVCEVRESIAQQYEKKIGKKRTDFTPTPEPVILNEDTQDLPYEEDYEPRYVEE